MTKHAAVTPIWAGGGGGLAWSCAARRRELQAEYFSVLVSLRLYLASCHVSASRGLSWASAGVLHRWLIGWLP